MTTWTNNSKNTTSFTNTAIGYGNKTWNEAQFPWNKAQGTWSAQKDVFFEQTKSSTSFTNVSKS